MEKSTVTCPACKAVGKTDVVEKAKTYEMHQCPECGVVFAQPMNHPGASWYHEAYSASTIGERALDATNPTKLLRGAHRPFFHDLPNRKGRLLDIGCGEGAFLAVVRQYYNVSGVDIQEQAVQKARKRYGLEDVHPGTLESFFQTWSVRQQEPYDVITLFDVLEHFEDPSASVNMIRTMLSPGGAIVITLPNRSRWPDFYREVDRPPNHLTRWDKPALTRFLSSKGFVVTRLEEFNEPGLATLRLTQRPLGILVNLIQGRRRLEVSSASAAGTGQSSRSSRLLGWAWLAWIVIAKLLDFPVLMLLALVRAPRQMLYCLARKPGSLDREGRDRRIL
jgi:SAM-dependent methyltransferase